MSGQFESNQLKLNLNAVVDNLNLVNVVHKPNPIVIEKLPSNEFNCRFPSTNMHRSHSQFEYIDENKLSMYSYLVQRDLKNKEWFSKYELNNFEQLVARPNEKSDPAIKTNKKENQKRSDEQSASTMVKPISKKLSPKITKSLDPNEFSLCCIDLSKNLENLLNILSEFKDERLKVVFNDPVEEEKQSRIHIEQIKYLSRSIYNYQNQISTLRSQIKKDKSLSSVHQRLIHTMRQIIKLIVSFGEIYPYRQDKSVISEKLCTQFYKNLNLSIKNFIDCLTNYEQSYIIQLNNLIQNCDKYFPKNEEKNQSEQMASNVGKESKQSSNMTKNTNQVFNVVRVSRSSLEKNNNDVVKVSSKRVLDKKKPKNQFSNVRFEISPPRVRPKQKFQTKKIKTAKLFPNNRLLCQSKSHSDLDIIPTRENNKSNIEIKPDRKSLEDLNSSLNELDILSKSNDQIYKPAFRHQSSPKLGKIKPILSRSISRSRSRSVEKNNSKIHQTISNETLLSDYPELEPYSENDQEIHSPRSTRSILKTRRYFNSTRLFEKLETIKHENDSIRRKYQNISYHSPGIESYSEYEIKKLRKPYQECYLQESLKPKIEDLECAVTFNKVYKPLNAPNLDQLKKVIKYAEDFKDYNRKTSVTKIGDSQFDDFKLFELLSNDIFDELFESIYNEIENLNVEVAQNLLNNEFESEPQEETDKIASYMSPNEYDQSFEKTIDSSKHLVSDSSPTRKITKTGSTQKSSSKTSTSSNGLSNRNDLNLNKLSQLIDSNVLEEIPDQINTHFSSIYSNIDESISSN